MLRKEHVCYLRYAPCAINLGLKFDVNRSVTGLKERFVKESNITINKTIYDLLYTIYKSNLQYSSMHYKKQALCFEFERILYKQYNSLLLAWPILVNLPINSNFEAFCLTGYLYKYVCVFIQQPSAKSFGRSPIDRHMTLQERKEALYEYARR